MLTTRQQQKTRQKSAAIFHQKVFPNGFSSQIKTYPKKLKKNFFYNS
jgi:hypothetical protein